MTVGAQPEAGRARPARVRRKRSAGTGALGVLALMFLLSGGVRLADGTGAGIWHGMLAFADSTAAETSAPGSVSQEGGDTRTPDAVLAALAAREKALDRREEALAERERSVTIAEDRITANLEALEEAERRLRETIALADDAAADDLERLTRMYESMKPKQAAALFETMDPNFAAGFLGQMRPDAAAAILADLAPETAYTISLVLAGRNMRVPTE